MHPHLDEYDTLYNDFRWHVPARFNIAEVCCTRWARDTPHAIAIQVTVFEETAPHSVASLTYAKLHAKAHALAAGMQAKGVMRGDCIAIVMPQSIDTAVAHMACYLLGAVAMPLSILFAQDALLHRLQDSGAVMALVNDRDIAKTIAAITAIATLTEVATCPALRDVLTVSQASKGFTARTVTPCDTAADDAAVLIYTSGTTGPAKGALIPHRALIGNLTGFVASQNFYPAMKGADKPVFWSPADWAWTGGLMDALLPVLYFGKPIIAYSGRFSAEVAFQIMHTFAVTHTFLFPTALKAMMKAYPVPHQHFELRLRAIMSAGEAVGETVYHWCETALGVRVNEMFGQTEINYIVGNSNRWPARAGSMGRGYPGHRVAVINAAGEVCVTNEIGDVAVSRYDMHGTPDPVFFLGYWQNQAATADKFTGNWCRTGDLAYADAEGYLWYQGRADDVFKAAGYRIGPSEVENCLLSHPSVANAAVVPKPDAARGAVVKAFVVLIAGVVGTDELATELQAHVRGRLAPYEYPKEIEWLEALPMTTTGKVQRRVLRVLEEERAVLRAI